MGFKLVFVCLYFTKIACIAYSVFKMFWSCNPFNAIWAILVAILIEMTMIRIANVKQTTGKGDIFYHIL